MNSHTPKIGIMDWGIGGMSVYQALRARGNTADVLYFSDAGSTPYGKQSRFEMRARFFEIGEFFASHGIFEVLVACNAASSALDEDVETFHGVKFVSIVPHAVRAVACSQSKRVGVIGGLLTISSGIYENRLRHLSKHFVYRPAQPLSALVEAGRLAGVEVSAEVKKVLLDLGEVDAILLACTHYPALADRFLELNPRLELLDPASEMIAEIKSSGSGTIQFCTTGNLGRSLHVAKQAFGITPDRAGQVALDLQAPIEALCESPQLSQRV